MTLPVDEARDLAARAEADCKFRDGMIVDLKKRLGKLMIEPEK